MPERSSLTQGVQLGVETTPGTSAAANKKLISIGIDAGIQVDMSRFRPMGQKYASVEVVGKEWVEADISGVGSYTELLYPFASCLCVPTGPVLSDGSAQTWTFTPAASAEDTIKTYTVEVGGSVRAHKFSYGVVSEIELDISRSGIDVSGKMLGQRITDNQTMTAGPTTITEQEILPTDIDVFLDGTSAGLGTTKLTRVLNVNVHLGDRFNPVWVLNTANNSFVATVEAEPSAEIKLLVEADTAGMAILTQMRGGTTQFIRVQGLSTVLAGAATKMYTFTWDAAVKVKDVGNFSDEDGVYAIEWTFDQVYDGTWTKAFLATLTNKITAL